MTKPFRCERTAFLNGQVSDFSNALDPREWFKNAPEIWNQSFLVMDPAGGGNPGPGVAAAAPRLPSGKRSDDPGQDKTARTAWGPPAEQGLFFEEALFAVFTYRNVLQTSYVDDSKGNPPSIRFQYREYDCLTTEFPGGPRFGGVDVDNGFSECVPVPDPAKPGQFIPGQVKIRFAKTVRFTQPDFCVDEVNALATILLPLAFDVWLQNLMF